MAFALHHATLHRIPLIRGKSIVQLKPIEN